MEGQTANQTTPVNSLSEIGKLKALLQQAKLPANLYEKALVQIERIELGLKYGGNLSHLDITEKYIDWITHLPWEVKSADMLDINHAKQILDKNHYGLESIKARVLEYLSVLIIHKKNLAGTPFHAPSLFFVGLAGTGKTTFAQSIAEALGRKFARIPLGGLSSAFDLRGQAKTSPEAEPSLVIRALRRVGTRNPVILLDELDRITPESRAAVMGVLLELLDPEQNATFSDYFLDYPFDLSEVLFVATANNTTNLSTAVLDRLELIQMPSYTDEEKIVIAKKYLLPRYIAEAGLTPAQLTINDGVWSKITRPLGFDAGIRTLERNIEGMVRRAAYKIVKGEGQNFTITEENLSEFLS